MEDLLLCPFLFLFIIICFYYFYSYTCISLFVVPHSVEKNLDLVGVAKLNKLLRFEIYVHTDGQL